ncbi:acyl-CoA dehydrogenase family protein [Streptomyces sp. NPDC052225]|uniref:acyl-CoA dehydrogenase family protein n=1 Tax=Streptomyces sp. NPDC052225 TaxID=3154949 RepID=UPI00342693D5
MSYRTALAQVLTDVVAPAAQQAGARGLFPRAAVTELGRTGLLGLTIGPECGGAGLGLTEAAEVVERTARVCPATAAVLRSHYAAAVTVEAYGGDWLRGEIAAGRHLCGLALAEDEAPDAATGGRLLAPRATAERFGGVVALRGRKHQVVAAGEADTYVWSARSAVAGEGLGLWVVPAHASGLYVPARPGGSGPRGSATSTVLADPVLVPAEAQLGEGGGGADVLRGVVVPWLAEFGAVAPAEAAAPLVTS